VRAHGLAWLAVAVLAGGALGGCSAQIAQSAQSKACQAWADGADALQAKLAACSGTLKQGAHGDEREQAFAQRGEARRLLSDDKAAVADFDQALRLNPADPVALNGRGLAYLDDARPDLALADFNAAIRANPVDGDAFDNRGYFERTKGDYAAAIADQSHAIALEPTDALPWANRGYDYAGKRQWDSAIADFNDALRLASKYAYALEGRGQSERGKGDAKAALQDYQMALNDPHTDNALADAQAVVELSAAGDPEALNTRCWVRGVNNTELAEGLADCQRSLATRPNSAETLDSLALIYFRQGRFSDAVTQYTAALALDPAQTPSQYMLGVAKLRTGDKSGDADIAAATAADKTIAGTFAGYGLKP